MTIWKVGTINATTTTLNGSITDVVTTIALTSSTGLQYPGVIVIDRVDANDTATPTVREYISFTGISGNSLTGCTRGLGGSTAQAHNSGAKVEEVWSITHWNDFLSAFDAEHGSDGTHDSATLALLAGAQTFTGAKTFTTGLLKAVDNTSGAGVSTFPTSTGTLATLALTETLTSKRIEPRIVSAASYTTDTGTSLSVATADIFVITAQAGALLFNAPGGTPVQGQKLIIRILDNGTARALTWNAVFRAMGTALPSTTVLSKTLYLGFIYNFTDTKWDLVASAQEA